MDRPAQPSVKASQRYAQLTNDRRAYLDRGRQCAALTIPAILPPQGFSSNSVLPTPYQSLGARGVRTLASKFCLSLFPGLPFFNYKLDDETLKQLGAKRGEIEKALSSRERATVAELDMCVFRPAVFMALLHLLVTGNAGLFVPPKQGERSQCYRLDQYVTRRDAAGNLLEFVIEETVDFETLPADIREAVAGHEKFKEAAASKDGTTPTPAKVYTRGYYEDGMWTVYQECEDFFVPATMSKFKAGEMPYLFLRFATQPSEGYGRGYVEEYLGDLDSLEALSEALVEGSAAAARVLFLVNPAGTTSIQVVATAKNGDVKSGNAADVTVMQLQKAQDLSVAKQQAEEIANRLSYAFLLHSSIQRSGERVTAEEIRYMASELDDALGGVYTLFAADLQLPVVRLFEKRMEKRLGAQKLPSNLGVHPVIVTGLEAIGRGHDQRNLQMFLKEVVSVLGPDIAMRYLKALEFISRCAAAYGIDTEGLLPTEEEVQKSEQLAQIQALVQNLGPQAITAMGGMGKEVVKGAIAPTGPAAAPQQ